MLTDRITLAGDTTTDPEDYLSTSLGVIFPDDITNQHGDADHHVIYTSPRLGEIYLTLADCKPEDNRLFSHFVWNAAVLLAALIEDGRDWKPATEGFGHAGMWDLCGKRVIELGAGTALAGVVAVRCGAEDTMITDYPAPEVLSNIKANVERNTRGKTFEGRELQCSVVGHEWGSVGDSISEPESREIDAIALQKHESFDVILVADCLWMPWQHRALMQSIRWFLAPEGRAWVVAGFHSGRAKMAGFFDEAVLAEQDLEIETIWERDAEDKERSWVSDRGIEDVTARKRWLVIAVLKRRGSL